MRTIPSIVFLLTLVLLPISRGQLTDHIDWPTFMARHDLVWTKMPEEWGQGAFQGNGQLGAMIFAGPGNSLDWRIGRTDVVFAEARLPIGDLYLHPVGKIQSCSMRLDLWNAEVTGTLKTDAGQIRFRSFTHASQMVQAIELIPTEGEAQFKFAWAPGEAVDPRLLVKKTPLTEKDKNPAPVQSQNGNIFLSSQSLQSGGGHVTAWKQITRPDGHVWLLLAVGYSSKDINEARAEATSDLSKAEATGFDALAATHRDWWHHYYPESFLSIPDTRLESFYWIQMYKLASATRADRPAIDLMGPWFAPTPWPKIWWNLNLQLTYWPVLTSNRLELGESLCRMLDRGAANLAKNAGEYSSDSATIGRSSSYDCLREAGPELCNLPWTMHNYYLQYRYSMDD
ncbi:MAG TPA: hypothetical protein VL981_04950, partial [Candidatus Methylacidiphilales bacterium]|nr:hypothetical protein [Candidatus Methylacidiphilales bacterium]